MFPLSPHICRQHQTWHRNIFARTTDERPCYQRPWIMISVRFVQNTISNNRHLFCSHKVSLSHRLHFFSRALRTENWLELKDLIFTLSLHSHSRNDDHISVGKHSIANIFRDHDAAYDNSEVYFCNGGVFCHSFLRSVRFKTTTAKVNTKNN